MGRVSLGQLPPLDGPPPPREGVGPLDVAGGSSRSRCTLFAAVAATSRLVSAPGGMVPLTVAVGVVLLAEAMMAVALSRNWQLSWWEWHVLMLLAFAVIALGARSEYRRRAAR